jgi:Nif-specific regulatory protein
MAAIPHQSVSLTKHDLDLLYELSTSVHSIDNLNVMLRRILSKIKEVFGIEGASIALHDAKNREFYFIRTAEEQRDGTEKGMDRMRFPASYGVAGWVLREKQSVMIHDVSKDDRFSSNLDIQKDFITRSMICVPLKTRKDILGVLYALNKLAGEFTQKDLFLLEILSSTIAIAVENATLYGDIRQYASTLEIENIRLLSEVQDRFNLQGIIGSSQAMRHVFALLDKVIGTTTTVFIQGETGTGKELLAKAIHYNSPLKGQPFVAENCGALTENLLESELFGHVKGAFTGAVSDKKGLFEMADGGTIFLDEIGDLPLPLQAKLLRVIEDREFYALGSRQTTQVDVRIISATNQNLKQLVEEKKFREDLYYRLNVMRLELPALKERKSDLPLLIEHILKRICTTKHTDISRIDEAAMAVLLNYDYPGNVRELENILEHAVIICRGDTIEMKHFPLWLLKNVEGAGSGGVGTGSTRRVWDEKERILDALRRYRWNKSQTARALNMDRSTLWRKMKKYHLGEG